MLSPDRERTTNALALNHQSDVGYTQDTSQPIHTKKIQSASMISDICYFTIFTVSSTGNIVHAEPIFIRIPIHASIHK